MSSVNSPSGPAQPADAPALRMRLVHSHGGPRQGVLSVAPGGFGMAAALELGGERLNDAQWRAANQCRLAWLGQGKGWHLTNGSHSLVCALNGERVTADKPMAVLPGDTLELGLLRFVIEAGAPDTGAVVPMLHDEMLENFTVFPAAGVEPVLRGAPRPRAGDGLDDFDLRDLALPPSHEAANAWPKQEHGADPFGVLDIAGAEARPSLDPLSELLGEAPPPPPARFAAQPTPTQEAEPLSQGRVSAVTQLLADGAPLSDTRRSPASAALFDELHEEFVRVVRDPTQLAGRTDWEGFLAPDGVRAPSLDELSQQAEPYPLLRDILLPREGIDQVIQDFDPLGRSTLLDVEGPDDVLRLFAPELAHNVRVAVPSLTRREHHELSPDSHVRIGAVRGGENDADGGKKNRDGTP